MSQPIFFSEGNLHIFEKTGEGLVPRESDEQEEDRVWNTWKVASSPFPHLCNGKLITVPISESLGGSQVAT